MRLHQPALVEHAHYLRRSGNDQFSIFDLEREPIEALEVYSPDVVVNLAGENRVDVVQGDPGRYRTVNVEAPKKIAAWCDRINAHYIHVSTQAVFSGEGAPYQAFSLMNPINEYGRQKSEAEISLARYSNWTVARPTFVLGIRPLKTGRKNPLEDILEKAGQPQQQVNDHFFSVAFAHDVAEQLWYLVAQRRRKSIVNLGHPIRQSRYSVAVAALDLLGPGLSKTVTGVSNDAFPGIAPRPKDTTYGLDAMSAGTFAAHLQRCVEEFRARTSD
jgi:dTDP-4-dehydrorhamnose reductase